MKKDILKFATSLFLVLSLGALVSCSVPNPIVGEWYDPRGSKLTLLPDYTYSARIIDENQQITDTTGTYSIYQSVIAFTSSNGLIRVTEWDYRGGILYLRWADVEHNPVLELHKYKN